MHKGPIMSIDIPEDLKSIVEDLVIYEEQRDDELEEDDMDRLYVEIPMDEFEYINYDKEEEDSTIIIIQM